MTARTIPAHRLRIMIRILSDEAAAGEAFPGTYAGRLLVVRDWLLEAAVTDVAIEREDAIRREEELAIERAGDSVMTDAPFKAGDLVRIKGNDHMGVFQVEECRWYVPRPGGAKPYWLCECAEQREVNWDDILPGQCGIVMPGFWAGNADHLVPA